MITGKKSLLRSRATGPAALCLKLALLAASLSPLVLRPCQAQFPRPALQVISTPFPKGLAFDGTYVWVVNSLISGTSDASVTKFRASDGSQKAVYTIYDFSGASQIVFDGTYMWVDSFNGGLARVLASNGGMLAYFDAGDGPNGMAFDGANIWITNGPNDAVTELRASDGATLGSFPAGETPIGIVYANGNLWVADAGGTVTQLRTSDGSIVSTFPAGPDPWALVLAGKELWVTNDDRGGLVNVLNSKNGAHLQTLMTGQYPTNALFDGTSIWISTESNLVDKVTPAQ